MAGLILQRECVVVLRRMIVDGIQDKFLDDTVAAINNMVAFILKLALLLHASLFFADAPKCDLMIVNTVHRQEEVDLLRTKIPHHEENKPD